ncbi:MAG: hypothetical protein K2W96_22850, partial [Gemmataceae bacterium]|nr:hypothetical protein [Gemmataceae bacterium]
MSEVRADYDGAWKELLERHAPEVLALLFPLAYDDIDWTRDWSLNEQELRSLSGESETGVRYLDKMLRAWTVFGDERTYHLEIQGTREDELGRRVYVYGYRSDDRFGVPADHLVVLTDDDPEWMPAPYSSELRYARLTLEFKPVKLVAEYGGREEELLAHPNLVALFVQAHLWSRQTLEDMDGRIGCKVRLIQELASRKLDLWAFREWNTHFDRLLPLPPEEKAEYLHRIGQLAKEGKMLTVSYIEEWAMERAMARAEEKVREKVKQEFDEVEKERDRAAQERDRAAQERDRAAQERDRAAQER